MLQAQPKIAIENLNSSFARNIDLLEQVSQILEEFVGSQMIELNQAIFAEDCDAVSKNLNHLQSILDDVGIFRVENAIKSIESAACDSQMEVAKRQSKDLENEILAALNELGSFCESQKN